MKEIFKGVFCDLDDIKAMRVRQINGDKLASSVYVYLYSGDYIYLFFQTVEEARKYVFELMRMVKDEEKGDC